MRLDHWGHGYSKRAIRKKAASWYLYKLKLVQFGQLKGFGAHVSMTLTAYILVGGII
jgi:hypothetical protein